MRAGYRPTFALYAVGRNDPQSLDIARTQMQALADCLTICDRAYLKYERLPDVLGGSIRYDKDTPPRGSACGDDDWTDIKILVERRIGDCFPVGSILLRDDYTLVPIESLKVGDRIWGYNDWTTVEAVSYKGLLSVDAMVLNNGSTVQLTSDHKVFVAKCEKHRPEQDDGYGCSCPVSSRTIVRTSLSDLTERSVMLSPESISFGCESLDPGVAFVEGLYVSDGWSSDNHRFAISGQDGEPKEEQKREVQAICERLGVNTRWHRKYIAVNDREWALRLHGSGTHAPNKRVLSLNYTKETAEQILRGVMADSGKNANGGRTFTTTSRELATQTRVLHKMFGRALGYSYIENHGGLGTNPIHRLNVRDPSTRGEKLLRVKRIERAVQTVPCYDIQTSDHYVYLPEHDVTVSNCDDIACARAAQLQHQGIAARAIPLLRRGNGKHDYHIVVMWPQGLGSYPQTVYRDPSGSGLLLEDPSRLLGMR